MFTYTEVVSDSNVARTAQAATHCRIDAAKRSNAALEQNDAFFDSDHLNRVEAAAKIVSAFFPVKADVYVNHRTNRGRPFSVVKVAGIGSWPSSKNKAKDLYQPLAALGMYEVHYMKNSNSYIYRIR